MRKVDGWPLTVDGRKRTTASRQVSIRPAHPKLLVDGRLLFQNLRMSATPASHPVATAALFGLWGLFWVTMTVVEMQDALLNPYIDWWEPVLWEGSSAIVATLWLLAQRRVDPHYQQYLERPWVWFLHHLKWFPLIAVTFIAAVYAMRHGVYALAGKTLSP